EQTLLKERHARVEAQTWQSIAAIAAAGGLAVVLTVLLSLQSARGVTKPVRRLCDAPNQLMAGHFPTLPPDGPTEIARLIALFNHMALTVSERASLLQRQEERYRAYIGAVSHILWTTDARGEVVGPLPTWQAFTGQTAEQVRGWGWLDAVHPGDR